MASCRGVWAQEMELKKLTQTRQIGPWGPLPGAPPKWLPNDLPNGSQMTPNGSQIAPKWLPNGSQNGSLDDGPAQHNTQHTTHHNKTRNTQHTTHNKTQHTTHNTTHNTRLINPSTHQPINPMGHMGHGSYGSYGSWVIWVKWVVANQSFDPWPLH